MNLFWHRRDLRIRDNVGLYHAAEVESKEVSTKLQPIFIFDPQILTPLKDRSDHRVTLIYDWLEELKAEYQSLGGDLWTFFGDPVEVFKHLQTKLKISSVYTNHDYEPLARKRDDDVKKALGEMNIHFQSFKDQVIFEKNEILSGEGRPYTVCTPFKKKWLSQFQKQKIKTDLSVFEKSLNKISSADSKAIEKKIEKRIEKKWVTLAEMDFSRSSIRAPVYNITSERISVYDKTRDFPFLPGTTLLGTALRFGKVSVREMANLGHEQNATWLSELIWREFFMQILFHFPQVTKQSFRTQYEKVAWRKDKNDFEKWKLGQTGYPIVDAGMRELNQTGYMHNRVRMIVGSFLTKHLLIHWYHGERYFAEKLFDFDLSANNGNWQWVAGTGCDAAPYFRIFNPESQTEKFDPKGEYIRRWVPEFGTTRYPEKMVEHSFARERALTEFKKALKDKE